MLGLQSPSKSPSVQPVITLSTAGERTITLDDLRDGDQTPKVAGGHQHGNAVNDGDDHDNPDAVDGGLDAPADDYDDDQQRPTPLESPVNGGFPLLEGEEGEPAAPTGFKRSGSFHRMAPSRTSSIVRRDGKTLHRMHKFALYETMMRFFLIGHDILDKRYRVLKIDRTAPPGQMNVVEDETVYTRREVNQLLNTIEDGNKAVGGIRYRGTSWGLIGFIRFTDSYYMLVISKKVQVATIGGHYIYQVEDTDLIPLTTGSTSRSQANRNAEESRFLSILGNLDLNRSFYFSYSYNVTRTLQDNVIARRNHLSERNQPTSQPDFNDMFVWNQHLLDPAIDTLKCPYDWCMPIIHGFIDQSTVDVFGRNIYLTIIARRSRFFAGARFLKRGSNDMGYVANDVETEQIVADMLVTSFNTPRLQHFKNPNYTSFVQHRGSIPLYWTQDNSGVSPRPAIDLNLIDPFYATVALHFNNLFERYSAPIYVLNLVKARERTPRESKLLVEYQNAINYLNQALPEDKRIKYRAYDMSRAAKTQGQDVIGTLEEIAEDIVRTTGFFQNNSDPAANLSCVQNGVARSNCIDCLDRTNAAQFVVGKRALACQLQALGVVTDASLNYDSDASNLFAHMFNDQGDTLASQYGGSHLVNTTDSYRKINNWQSHSRDMLESFKRYYHNSFLDNQRQEAYNLFLGNYIYAQGRPMLWELPNDYYLHHANPAERVQRRDYIKWYDPVHLEPRRVPPVPSMSPSTREALVADWWDEYYRPQILSSFHRLFAFHINSTTKYLPKPRHRPNRFDMSPFSVRKTAQEMDAAIQGLARDTPNKSKEVAIADSNSRDILNPLSASSHLQTTTKRISSLQKWLFPTADDDGDVSSINADQTQASTKGNKLGSSRIRQSVIDTSDNLKNHNHTPQERATSSSFKPSNKKLMNQWTLAQFHANSLHPSVTCAEGEEYGKYLAHPLQLGLDDSSEAASSGERKNLHVNEEVEAGSDSLDGGAHAFLSYINSASSSQLPVTHRNLHQRLPPVGAPSLQRTASAPATSGSTRISSQSNVPSTTLADDFASWLATPDEPLAVHGVDLERKRYRAYGKWVRGKSLFKQSIVETEAQT